MVSASRLSRRKTGRPLFQKRGDAVMFVVTGQVHRYHGANYLLPTMMKLEPNRGNLQQ